jgi:hypothetical protein
MGFKVPEIDADESGEDTDKGIELQTLSIE